MRRFAFAVTLFAFTCHTAAQQPEPQQKTDLELIQGAWLIVGLESNGKVDKGGFNKGKFTFRKDNKKGGNIASLEEVFYPQQSVDFGFSLDQKTSPKAIDFTIKGATALGIYKLNGDDLTICVSLGGPRPTEFTTKSGGDTEVFTLKRNRWERFSERSFSVEFPGKPTESKRESALPSAAGPTITYTVRHEMERVSYSVSVTPLVGRLDSREAESTLAAVQKAMLAEIDPAAKPKLQTDSRPFKPLPTPQFVSTVREFTINLEPPNTKDRGVMRVRLMIAGERLFTQVVSGTDESMRMSGLGQFWSSFAIPRPGKKGSSSKY